MENPIPRRRAHAYPATLYQIFDVPPGVPDADLHARFRALAAAWHPDNANGGDVDRYKALTEAWSLLKTPALRRQYQGQLLLSGTPCPACGGAGLGLAPLSSWSSVGFMPVTVECAACEGTGQQPLSETRSAFPARAGRLR